MPRRSTPMEWKRKRYRKKSRAAPASSWANVVSALWRTCLRFILSGVLNPGCGPARIECGAGLEKQLGYDDERETFETAGDGLRSGFQCPEVLPARHLSVPRRAARFTIQKESGMDQRAEVAPAVRLRREPRSI